MPLPLAYDGTEARYLQRDGARFCGYLRDHGVEAIKLLVDDGRGHAPPRSPLLGTATWDRWCSPQYWKLQKPDLVLLYGGLQRRLEPVAAAIHHAGIPLALKMDSSSGVLRFPRLFCWLLRTQYYGELRRHGRMRAAAMALSQQARWAIGCRDRFLERYLALFDIITVEHEFAMRNTQDWLRSRHRSDVSARVRLLHHPVPETFAYTGRPPKRALLLAVALDWTNPRKGGALLSKTLAEALPRLAGYEAMIVGGGSDALAAGAVRRAPSIAGRVRALPIQTEPDTYRLYCESRALLMTSGSEGAPNVVSEAACCGCSTVFPPELRQLTFLSKAGAGCMATMRSARSMADAVVADAHAWERGERCPVDISALWCGRFHVGVATQTLLGFFGLGLPTPSRQVPVPGQSLLSNPSE